MAREHTPSPWQQNGSHVYGPDPMRRIICEMHYAGRGYQSEDAGNERLILSSPDLFAASKALILQLGIAYAANPEAYAEFFNEVADPESFGAAVNAIKSAIAKAEGR